MTPVTDGARGEVHAIHARAHGPGHRGDAQEVQEPDDLAGGIAEKRLVAQFEVPAAVALGCLPDVLDEAGPVIREGRGVLSEFGDGSPFTPRGDRGVAAVTDDVDDPSGPGSRVPAEQTLNL